MSPTRRIAAITGVLFLITFITSIPAKLLYDSVLNHSGYMAGAGSNATLLLAAFLELILIKSGHAVRAQGQRAEYRANQLGNRPRFGTPTPVLFPKVGLVSIRTENGDLQLRNFF